MGWKRGEVRPTIVCFLGLAKNEEIRMLVFVVPLKSKKKSKSWQLVSCLLERCLKSICNQTLPNFKVIVVCNERPELNFHHPSVTYLEVNFSIEKKTKSINYKGNETDKNRKIYTGLLYAERFNPSYICLVDADDCVSRRLVEFVNKNPQSNGWFINKGYEYKERSKSVFRRKKNFHLRCGTSHIIRFEALKPLIQCTRFSDIDWKFLYHQDIVNIMKAKKCVLDELPFEGAIKIVDNGENIVDQESIFLKIISNRPTEKILFYFRKILKKIFSQPLSQSIRNEFGLYDIEM